MHMVGCTEDTLEKSNLASFLQQ